MYILAIYEPNAANYIGFITEDNKLTDDPKKAKQFKTLEESQDWTDQLDIEYLLEYEIDTIRR